MRIVLYLIPFLILAGVTWRLRARERQALEREGRAADRLREAERAEMATLRLLRSAGGELREQGLALLGQSEVCSAEYRKDWAAIAARLLAMADDLQDHAPPSPESRVLVRESIALRPLVESCVEAVSTNLRPSVRLWKLAPELEGLQLHGDRRALTQVILRILANAARTTRNLDWIEVGAEREGGQIVLSVLDEGSGMLALSPHQPRDGRASGVGLAVAQSLVRAHGGSLKVEAVPGVGAKVEIALPVMAHI